MANFAVATERLTPRTLDIMQREYRQGRISAGRGRTQILMGFTIRQFVAGSESGVLEDDHS